MNNQRGSVYLETLIGFLPVFMFFVGTLQVADASVARLVVEHAATTAARAAVVVLPDDGAYYRDADNNAVHQFRDYRQSDVERAADTILAAQGRLGRSLTNVALDKDSYAERELVTARVTAPYRCWITVFCPAGLTMRASAQLVYQGAKYKYEASTGWATSAANRGLGNITGPRANPNDPNDPNDPSNPNDGTPNDPSDPNNPNDGTPNDPNDPNNSNDGTPNNPSDPNNPNDGTPNNPNDPSDPNGNPNNPNDPGNPNGNPSNRNNPNNPNDPNDGTTRPGDGTTRPGDGTTRPGETDPRPRDPELQRREEQLQRALPPNLRDTPVRIDPSLDGTTVRVRYTHNDRGVITGVEIVAGPDAQPRHIRDHAPTVRTMQRYQGVAGRARALLARFTSWLTGNPNAGPGTLAWESRREVEKLTGIIESRQRELEDPNLTPERRRELERELASYERQLAYHEQVLTQVTNDPGRGYVAANSEGQVGRDIAEKQYPKAAEALPPGYGWRLDGNRLSIVRLPGHTGKPRRFDAAAAERAERSGKKPDPNEIFPEIDISQARFREGSEESHRPTDPAVIERMDRIAQERRDQTKYRDDAEAEVTRLANALGLDPKEVAGDKGQAAIDRAKQQPNLTDAQKQQLADLQTARNDLTEARNKLNRASEQLGNEMAIDYMKQAHPNARRVFPPVDRNDPDAPLPAGTSGEFDLVYVEGDPPNQTVFVIEAKGASSGLGESKRAGGQQGSPEYLDYITRQMLGSAESPLSEPLEDILMRDQDGGANVRYLLVEAPVDVIANPTDGRVREFDL